MFNRRQILQLVAGAGLALAAGAAHAQAWKEAYPELTFAIIPAENASGVTERFTPFVEYLSREIGVPVKLRIVQDYAGVIEGLRANQIQIAMMSASSYARAYITGAKIEPFAIEVNADGSKSYRSVFYVRKDSPYQKIEDLKGKNLGLVDPNSTSGNSVPRFALDKMGINPAEFFGKVVYTGSHENAIIALQQGTIDVATNWWTDENESNLRRMERKGLTKYDDFRIIFSSDPIVNAPIVYQSALPDDLKSAVRDAIFSMRERRAEEIFKRLYDGTMRGWDPVTHEDYEPYVGLIKFVDELRKRS
jgi:phosphonate transport system substrate-binding protein